MIRDIGEDSFHQAHVYGSLKDDSETELYPGCSSFTRLSTVLRLFNIKARNGLTDKSFTELLESFHQILPKGNTLPTSHYEAKKILCPMGMELLRLSHDMFDSPCAIEWDQRVFGVDNGGIPLYLYMQDLIEIL